MKIATNQHRLPEILPLRQCLQFFSTGRQRANFMQEFVFDKLQLLELVQRLVTQRLKLQFQDMRQLRGEFLGLIQGLIQNVTQVNH